MTQGKPVALVSVQSGWHLGHSLQPHGTIHTSSLCSPGHLQEPQAGSLLSTNCSELNQRQTDHILSPGGSSRREPGCSPRKRGRASPEPEVWATAPEGRARPGSCSDTGPGKPGDTKEGNPVRWTSVTTCHTWGRRCPSLLISAR